MLTPPNQQQITDTLLGDLEDTPTDAVGDAARRAGHFSVEDEENHKRGIRSKTRETIANLKRWFLYVLFGIVSFLAIAVAIGFVVLTGFYVFSFSNDADKLGAFLGNVAIWVLIALATLFIERIMPDRE